MELSFVTLDVFTNKRFEGNPLAVVTVPASLKDKVSQEKKQQIAREFNLSETVFLHEPAAGGTGQPSEVSIDIFTIESELPFAGHPTIGSAVLCKYHLYPSVETLITKAGPIGLSPIATGADAEAGAGPAQAIRARIPHNVHLHSKTLADVVPTAQHDSYPGLSHYDPVIREAELRAPVFSIVKGMTFVLVRLPSLEHLGRVRAGQLDFDALPEPITDPEWSPTFTSRYYYVEEEEEEEEDGTAAPAGTASTRNLRTRMVEMAFEDPATGSAASTLAAYLTAVERKEEISFVVVQGVEIGRRSVIHVQTTAETLESGEVALKELWLGGEAAIVQKGVLTVD
ncbi:hypothetical protein BX600DRAFT_429089 [Xylariales sp. PMI_506]|nr:hypothetical protein BX600DRAFT_429089 [Xylariales sp. PMI_506]